MNQKIVLGIITALLALTMLTSFASAAPAGPMSLVQTNEETWPVWAPLTVEAIAGNVSELTFNASTVTRTYQGYYGNITGLIVLGDSNNNTLYDWSVASPQGEIYAVRSSTVPSWESVTCAAQWELQEEDLAIGVNETIDEDSVNRTFVVGGSPDQLMRFPALPATFFGHTQFWVANQSIAADSCPVATLYNSTYEPSEHFKEVLLSDNVNTNASGTGFVIYTGIIAHTTNPFAETDGFNDMTHDFEMMVGEDGHGAQTGSTATSTPYWFYVELT